MSEKSAGQAACEAFWRHLGAGPDGQPVSAAWDWAATAGTREAWEYAALEGAVVINRGDETMRQPDDEGPVSRGGYPVGP